MRPDLEQKVEAIFIACRFDPRYMDEHFTKQQIRTALETLTDEEYARICLIMEEKT